MTFEIETLYFVEKIFKFSIFNKLFFKNETKFTIKEGKKVSIIKWRKQ